MFERLARVDRDFIKSQIQQGCYTSEIEVVRDAIRRLREEGEQKTKLAVLRDLVMVGHLQADRGNLIAYTDDFADKAMERAISNHRAGVPIKDEIKS